MAKILIVDDETNIRQLIRVCLRDEGFEIVEAANGQEALTVIATTTIDLVIIDIMMPVMDGWELCKELRQNYELPLLMLTAKGDYSQIVNGFQLGTDDYMVKPFHPMELVLRVRALLRRYRIETSLIVQAGELTVDRTLYEVRVQDQRFSLPLKEFELLFKLVSNVGQILTRDQLIEQVWGVDFKGDERTVDVHIKRLRERFEGLTSCISIITVRGLGYRLEVLPL